MNESSTKVDNLRIIYFCRQSVLYICLIFFCVYPTGLLSYELLGHRLNDSGDQILAVSLGEQFVAVITNPGLVKVNTPPGKWCQICL